MSRRAPPAPLWRDEDYARVGLRVGLEVHQQLATARKLFCRCPAHLYTKDYHATVLRHMRPTLSELGEYDGTALMEHKTRKAIHYQIHRSNICTYELDDAPPFELNPDALARALEIAHALGATPMSEVHVARKQYLDGSIPAGFQRTAVVALGGEIEVGEREIPVLQLGLEEDSAREVSDVGHVRVFNTSRLSVPLVEIVTAPALRTPAEAEAAARAIRTLTRATGVVRRGIGAARQDVNVSISGGTRVEIKGVPRHPMIPALVHFEVIRQRALLDLRDKLAAQGRTLEGFAPRHVDLTAPAAVVAFAPIQAALSRGGVVWGLVLPGFQEVLNLPLGPERIFADELSDQARVVGCLDQLPNLVHHPAPSSPLPAAHWARLRAAAAAGQDDALIVVWGPWADVRTAVEELEERARAAFRGVPPETRQFLPNGTTRFERVLPGAGRMYPETDLPPVVLTRARRSAPPQVPPAKVQRARLMASGMRPHQAEALLLDGRFLTLEPMLLAHQGAGLVIAHLLLERARAWRRAGGEPERVQAQRWAGLVERLVDGRLSREALDEVLPQAVNAGEEAWDALLDQAVPPASAVVRAAVRAALSLCPRSDDLEAKRRFWMGHAMRRLRHRAVGVQVAQVMDAFLEAP